MHLLFPFCINSHYFSDFAAIIAEIKNKSATFVPWNVARAAE